MQYKLKNISGKDFLFEGVTVKKGKTSDELTPEVYQRLLSLYYGHTLMPIDDPSYGTPDVKIEVPEKEPEKKEEKEGEKEEEKEEKDTEKEPEKPKSFVCEICKKEFASNRGLLTHVRFAHKEKEKVEIK